MVYLMMFLLAGFALCAALWLSSMVWLKRTGWRRWIALCTIQLSLLTLAYGLIRGQPGLDLLIVAFPPALAFHLNGLVKYMPFMSQVLAISIWPTLAVLFLSIRAPRLRPWSPAISGLVLLLGSVVIGDRMAIRANCTSAAERGFHTADYNTLWFSLQNAPQEFQFLLHASADLGDRRFAWSYATLDWYELGPEVRHNVNRPLYACPGST